MLINILKYALQISFMPNICYVLIIVKNKILIVFINCIISQMHVNIL